MSTGQTLNDRLTAAKHTLAGQGLARIVCKATTEEVIGPKKKHIDNLIHCTNEPNVSIPQLANLLIERTQHNSWVVVFKSLITVHHLMCYGNERFTQYLASSNCTFQLGSFIDKCGVQGYDMSTFIRRYAKYLNEKAIAYRTVAFDFCKCKRGKEDGILRQMNTEKLLKTLPTLQNQLDALLEFDCSSNDLSNGVVSSSFMLLFRDLIRLFACYNDGIINLLEKYFEMNKKHCRDALDIYKKFLIRMDRVAEFLKVAENVGIDKGEIPDLTKLTETCRKLPLFESNDAPSSLLEALEQHLATLEGRKGSTSAASAATRATNLRNAVSALSHTSNAFGSAGENGSPTQEINGVKVDESVRKAVEEEAEVMNQLKFDNESPLLWEQPAWEDSERRMKDLATGEMISPPGGVIKTNPFLASPAEPTGIQGNQAILDLFSSPTSPPTGGGGKNDLLSLNNPFADSLFGGSQDQQGQQDQTSSFPSFGTNGFTSATTPSVSAFASDASFAAAFGDTSTTDFPAAPTPTVATPSEVTTVKLTLPVLEPFGGRSTSPSPTTDLMRGAGTTPILANPPDGGFGDAVDGTDDIAPTSTANEEPSDFTWGTDMAGVKAEQPVITSAASGTDPFGAPFEPQPSTPQPPTAVVPPLSVRANDSSKADLFGLDSSEFGDFGEQPSSAQPCAPPPSPFGGLDLVGGPDLRAQAMANAGGMMPPGMTLQQKTSQGATGIDNLNFAIQKAMQMPSAMSPTFPQQPMPGAGMVAPGFGNQPFPPMNVCLPPGSTPPASATFSQLDILVGSGMAGTPSARASSTPGYGTPPSGLSSPAKSVSGVGAHGTGGFDAFGDTLQPQTPTGKASSGDKPASSILKGDLDSTLANLASNLDINGPKQAFKKTAGHQWGSPKPGAKTAGSTAPGWAASVPGGAPPASGVQGVGMGWSASPQHGFQQPAASTGGQWGGAFQQQVSGSGGLPQQPYMVGGVRPGMAGMGMNMGMAPQQAMPQQTQMFPGFSPQMAVVPPTSAALPSQAAQVNDPFGAL